MHFADTFRSLDPSPSGEGLSEEVRRTGDFLLRCILGARAEVGFESTDRGQHEDVNVYLVNLLGQAFSPEHLSETKRYLHLSDIDLFRAVESSRDNRLAFRLYKVNADYLLLAVGIFCHIEGAHHPGKPLAHREPEEFISRGGTYYQLASSYLRRVQRRPTASESVLRKLADNFGPYVEVMRRVRSTYFHLTDRMSEGTLYHLMRSNGEEASPAVDPQEAYDAFLDAYSAWKEQPGDETVEALREAAAAVKDVDPDFAFELPDAE